MTIEHSAFRPYSVPAVFSSETRPAKALTFCGDEPPKTDTDPSTKESPPKAPPAKPPTLRGLFRDLISIAEQSLAGFKKGLEKGEETASGTPEKAAEPTAAPAPKKDYTAVNQFLALVKTGNTDDVEKALATANPNDTNEKGENALMVAIQSGHTELVKKFAPLTKDLTARSSALDMNPLEMAVSLNQSDMVKTLLAQGAKVDDGAALCHAAEKGLTDLMAVLLETKPDLTKTHSKFIGRAVHVAAAYGKAAILEQLRTAGADINDPNSTLGPPLVVAAANGQVEAVEYLLSDGVNADVNAVHPEKKQTAYQAAMDTLTSGNGPLWAGRCAIITNMLEAAGADTSDPLE